jgi:REP element-mobilizing transposase RayT
VDIIFDNLEFCRKNKGLEVFHYVLMPSHLHLIARRKQGLLSDVLRDFKSYTAKQLLKAISEHPQESRKEWMMQMFREHGMASSQNTELMFWQKTSHPELLHSPAFFDQKAEYIRNNPVEMGLVTEPEHYAWSSAHPDPRLTPDAE